MVRDVRVVRRLARFESEAFLIPAPRNRRMALMRELCDVVFDVVIVFFRFGRVAAG